MLYSPLKAGCKAICTVYYQSLDDAKGKSTVKWRHSRPGHGVIPKDVFLLREIYLKKVAAIFKAMSFKGKVADQHYGVLMAGLP
jgi:hypothetical protein